jgi:hypothetical protein
MQRIRSSDWSKAGKAASLLRSLVRRQGANWTLVGLLLVGLLRVAPPLYAQRSRTVSTTLILQVAEAGLLELQNDSVIVKLRLTPGVAVNLWGDKACTIPADESYIITASGTYTIPLSEIKQAQNSEGADIGSICLQSSDGVLHSSLPANGGALLTGTTTSATKISSKSTWSGRVSIPAGRVSSAKNPSMLPPHQ